VAVFNSYRGVPLPVAVLAALLACSSYITNYTSFGVWLYAIGGNREAARRGGIPVNIIKIAVFSIMGMLTALGGVFAAARVLGVSPASADQTLLLEAVAAAVIGGTSLFGGRGGVWGTVLGALVIGSIANGMFLLDASTKLRLAVQGPRRSAGSRGCRGRSHGAVRDEFRQVVQVRPPGANGWDGFTLADAPVWRTNHPARCSIPKKPFA
jgi:ABC-type xylose transport system permease subunit